MSSIYVGATIKCLLLIFMALATVNANSFFDKREAIKLIDEVESSNVIQTFNNVTNDCARKELRGTRVIKNICDQVAAMETAVRVNTTLESDRKVEAWCNLVHTLLGEPENYSCDRNATNTTTSFLHTFCIAEQIADFNKNEGFPSRNVVFNSFKVVTGDRA